MTNLRTKMTKLSKKAQISKSLVDFAGYGTFVIVFLVFLLLFNIAVVKEGPRENKLNQIGFGSVTSDYVLLNFLRSDVYDDKISKESIKMSDYIVLAAYEESDRNYPFIKRQLDSYFGSFNGCYEMSVLKDGKSAFYITSSLSGSCSSDYLSSSPASVKIPSKNSELVEVKLWADIK